MFSTCYTLVSIPVRVRACVAAANLLEPLTDTLREAAGVELKITVRAKGSEQQQVRGWVGAWEGRLAMQPATMMITCTQHTVIPCAVRCLARCLIRQAVALAVV